MRPVPARAPSLAGPCLLHEEYRRFYSHNLGTDLEMMVFGDYGYPVIVFPTSNGRYYEAKDFHLVDSVRWFIENRLLKLVCIDSGDKWSWYAKHLHPGTRVHNHNLYDRMVSEELVPRLQQECQVEKVGVAGCSLGGYQALNFAFRHPEQGSASLFDGRVLRHSHVSGWALATSRRTTKIRPIICLTPRTITSIR